MLITALTENTSAVCGIGCEHGLSLFIETENHRILFDTGQTRLFAENAEKLGIRLDSVDFAVISHGHYDHGGGLKEFLKINGNAPVYLNKNVFGKHYNGTEKYIGLDPSLMQESRLIFTEGVTEVAQGIRLFDCNGMTRKYGWGSFGLNKLENGVFIPDDFIHEHYLLIEENEKKVLISGCSHKGILNITDWFEPDALIGGFHFSKLPPDGTLKHYAKILNGFKTHYYTCHCTGTEQFEFMKKYMSRLSYLSAGMTIQL